MNYEANEVFPHCFYERDRRRFRTNRKGDDKINDRGGQGITDRNFQ